MARICWGESARLAGIFSLCKCGGLWYNTVNIEAEVEKALMKKRWKRLGIGIAAGDGAYTMTAEEQRNLTAQLFLQNIP